MKRSTPRRKDVPCDLSWLLLGGTSHKTARIEVAKRWVLVSDRARIVLFIHGLGVIEHRKPSLLEILYS